MKISVSRKENLEVEVGDLEVFRAFLDLLSQKLPYGTRSLDLFIRCGELYFTEEVGGHNRDWETVRLKDRYPNLEITEGMMRLVKFRAEVKSFQDVVLGPPYC